MCFRKEEIEVRGKDSEARRDGYYKDADKHLGKAKKCINLLKANNNENNNT